MQPNGVVRCLKIASIVGVLLMTLGCWKQWHLNQTVQFGPGAPQCSACPKYFRPTRGSRQRYRYVPSCDYEMITGSWWWIEGFNGGSGGWDGWTIIRVDPGSPVPQKGDQIDGDLSGTGPRTVSTFNPNSGLKVTGIHIEIISHETTDDRFIALGCLKLVP